MICPNDNVVMRRVLAPSHYGKQITLEQCRRCGGIWFDESELHEIRRGEAEKIELVDSTALRILSPIKNSVLRCPKDQEKLICFKDPAFPPDLLVESCPACRGFWLKRGEFLKYQKHTQEKVVKPKVRKKTEKDEEFEDKVEKLLALHQGNRYDTLGKLAKFLSAPVDPLTMRPYESDKLSPKEERALNFTLNILVMILNIFLRR